MAKQSINLGSSANDGTGTTLRAGGDLVNDNFDELYTALGTGSALAITVSGASNGQALVYSSSNARFEPANQSGGVSNIVEDTSPQLGGNLDVNGQSIISASNNNIPITPNGSGKVILDGVDWPTSAGTNGYFLQTNGSDAASWATALTDIVGDTSPQLGGDLDTNSYNIAFDDAHGINDENGNEQIIFQTTSSAVNQFDITNAATGNGPTLSATGGDTNIDVNITPKGSGNLVTTNLTIDSLTMSGSGNVTFTAATTLALNANTGGTVVVNDGSNNADFRVESDNNANMLFVDAGSDHVNIGTATDHGGVLNVEHGDNTDTLMLVSTDADASVGPNLTLYRNSASPADSDDTGIVNFRGRNDNSQDVEYAQIKSIILDQTDGTEDGKLELYHMLNGSLAPSLQLTSSEVVINESSNDIDFRVESNGNANMIFVDSGNDHVNIGTASDLGGTFNVSGTGVFQTADNTTQLTLSSTDADANSGPALDYYRNSSSPADADYIGTTRYIGRNDNSQDVNYVAINVQANDVSDGTEDATYIINRMKDGSSDQVFNISPDAVVINEDSKDVDFRIESDNNTAMFKVDAGMDSVLISTESDQSSSLAVLSNGESAIFAAQIQNADHPTATWKNVYANGSNSATMFSFTNSGNTEVGSIKSTGSATAFNTSSDYRLKENVDYTWDATTRLKQLKPARFNWISDDTNTLLDGFLAHEVSSIVPEAISGTKDAETTLTKVVMGERGNVIAQNIEESAWTAGKADGTYDSNTTWHASKTNPIYQQIDQAKLVPLLVKTIQELEARITTLEG